jgi:hypothetical protein
VRLLPELDGGELGIYAVYPSRKHLSGKVRAFVDILVTAFRDPPWAAQTKCNAEQRDFGADGNLMP